MNKVKQAKQLTFPREVYELALEAAMGKLRATMENVSMIRAALSELNSPLVESPIVEVKRGGRGPMTPEGRARIAAAQKRRWARAKRMKNAAAKAAEEKKAGKARARKAEKEKAA